MFKSKSMMTAAAAALAVSMAGSAFAQDGRFDRGDHRDRDDRNGRYEQQHRGPDRFQDRHDRQDFRAGRQFERHGYANPHAEWRRGGYVPREYRGRNYVVNDWRGHRLQQPPRGYQWVGVGGDYVLAAIATGLIAQIIASQ